MNFLVDRKTEILFKTSSVLNDGGKARPIVIESRPNYAVLQLAGSKTKYAISWEHIFRLAKDRHAANLRLEEQATRRLDNSPAKQRSATPGKRSRRATAGSA